MLKAVRYMILLGSILFLLIGLISTNFNIILTSILILWLSNMIYVMENVSKRIVLGVFNISFFTLLLGQYFFEMVNGEQWWGDYPDFIILHTLISVYLSLFFIFIGSIVFEIFYKGAKDRVNYSFDINHIDLIQYIRKVSKIMFFITFIFSIPVLLERVIFVQSNGYLSLYTEFSTRIPLIIRKIAGTNQIFLYIFLATLPKKKDSKLVLVLYISYLVVSMLDGTRGAFVTGLLVLIIYAIFRDTSYKDADTKWIGKLEKLTFMIISPFLIAFLSIYNSIRNNIKVGDINILYEITNFFKAQGSSINVISNGKLYEHLLPSTNLSYSFGPLINNFTRGNITTFFTGLSPLKGNTVEMAQYGNNFGATISYLAEPIYYLSGGGLGTQYIAEIYADFGYIGVIVFNIILGSVMSWIAYISFKKWWTFSIGLLFCFSIVYMSRESALSFIGTLFSLTTWLPILFTFIIANSLRIKNINKSLAKSIN